MERQTFNIMFFIKRTKLLKNNEAPILMRITINGERAEISVHRSIHPDQWNKVKGCAKQSTASGKELNHYLDQIRYQIYLHQQELKNKNKPVTPVSLRNAYLKIGNEVKRFILQVYKDHNDDLKSRIDKGVSKATFIRHESSRNNLERFIIATYNSTDYNLNDIGHTFISKYEVFLRTKRNCNNNSTMKYISNFSKVIKLAMDNEWIKNDPLSKIKLKLEEVNKPFLNRDEVTALISKNFNIPRIAQVRDIFVFCCYTGLAYIDVKSLCKKDIEVGVDDNIWIRKQRHKSKQWAHIPLLPVAKEIINRYAFDKECIKKGVLLPVLSNQKMNAYLKEIADICGITKNLTTHCARHTFATTVTLANQISMESVSKMLGHASLTMTRKYARILDATIGKEMSSLAEKLKYQQN
jgi:site-specific recombinase XerD